MRAIFFCLVLFSFAGFAAGPRSSSANGRPITVVLDFEKPHSSLSIPVVQSELRSILRGAGLRPDVVLKSDLPPAPQLGDLVIFKMKGFCGMDFVPLGALSDERGPLAMTYESDGQLLSFGAVECDRVRHSLQRISSVNRIERPESVFGRAIARVVAHEMYHMIANSRIHTSEGITKESLSSRELSQGYLQLSNPAGQALRNAAKR